MQHTKYYSRASYNCAAHEDGSCVVHEIELTCSTQKLTLVSRVTCEFALSNLTKIQEHTCVAAYESQLRRKWYRMASLE